MDLRGPKGQENLSMLADFYEFTMGNGYMENGLADQIVYYDMFFRRIPDEGGYAIVAGLEQVIHYMENLHFTEEDIEFLRSKGIFGEPFLEYLQNFEFSCDVWAVPEGTPVFPQEPLVVVRGPAIQAQLLETMVLLTINHQTLIATKASRIVRSAQGRAVVEFGSRRAQGFASANFGARAAYIGGCAGTANTLADLDYGVPAAGTMAHSWVQMFETEKKAFEAYAKVYPDSCFLLVDTYNTLKEGIPHAIEVFNEVLLPQGYRPKGIRIDSGDMAYLSKKARAMLDEAGFEDVGIMLSGGLDEYTIEALLLQGAQVDSFGVGERLITSRSEPVFGGVYKLTTVEVDGERVPKIKISENVEKITTPEFKQVYRFFDKSTHKAFADVVTLHDEVIDESKPYELFHPIHTWKRKTITNFDAKPLLVPIYEKGKLVYELPSLQEIRDYSQRELDGFWEEIKRMDSPHMYVVDLSKELWSIKNRLLSGQGR